MTVFPFIRLSRDFIEVEGVTYLEQGGFLYSEAVPVGQIRGNRAYLTQATGQPTGGSWYVPDNLSRVFRDTAGQIPAVLGNTVGLLLDGELTPATQAQADRRPTLMQNGGKYMLGFDGVNDSLIFTPPPITSKATLVWSGALSNLSGIMLMGQSNAGANLWLIGGKVWAGQLIGTDINAVHPFTTGIPFVISAQLESGGTWRLRANGVELISGPRTATFTGASMGMMSQNGAAYWAAGRQAFCHVSNRVETPTELYALEQLAAQYAGVALP